jgi:hypothetical protein
MASIAINHDSVIASIKSSIASQMAALRELGMDPEQIAKIVFAATMEAGSISSSASVATDDAKPAGKAKAVKAPKKAKDPSAPKKPMNAGLADYNARFDAWWDENKTRLETEWAEQGEAYELIQTHYEAKMAEYETAKEKAESKGKELKKSEPRMPSKMSKPTAKVIFSELPEQKARQSAAAEVSKAKAKEKAAAKKAAKTSSASSVASDTSPQSDSQEDQDWTPLSKDGKDYIYNDQGHCYLYVDGEQVSWAGLYDPETDILDNTIEEP